MRFQCTILVVSMTFITCTTPQTDHTSINPSVLEGTWKLVSGMLIEKGDTTLTDYTKDRSMIKILNASHFAFLNHDLQKGKDSTALFVAGGGTYKLEGDQYTENLEYCSARDWEGNTFHFTVTISGDTLVQQGIEKLEDLAIERMNIETYVRLNDNLK